MQSALNVRQVKPSQSMGVGSHRLLFQCQIPDQGSRTSMNQRAEALSSTSGLFWMMISLWAIISKFRF